jgi:membrane-associated phospholipid phosphatase
MGENDLAAQLPEVSIGLHRKIMDHQFFQHLRRSISSERFFPRRARLFQGYILIALLGFSALTVFAQAAPHSVEVQISLAIQTALPAWVRPLLIAVSWPGYMPQSVVMVAIPMIILGMIGLRWEAVGLLFATLFTGSLNYLLKIAIRRPRPTDDLVEVFQVLNSYSFPSGHVMFYTAFFGFLVFLVYLLLPHSFRRAVFLALLFLPILLVSLSRVYLGEHWASDVLAGYLLASLSLMVSVSVYHWGRQRFFVPVTSGRPWRDPQPDPWLPESNEKGDTTDEHHTDRRTTGDHNSRGS